MAKRIKLGNNGRSKFSVPLSIPIITQKPVQFSVVDLKLYPEGIEVSDEQFTIMSSETNIGDLMSSGLVGQIAAVSVFSDNSLTQLVSEHETIQEALDSGTTVDGCTITVASGTFTENLSLSKAVSIIGTAGTVVVGTVAVGGPAVTTQGAIKTFNSSIENIHFVAPDGMTTDNMLISWMDGLLIKGCQFEGNGVFLGNAIRMDWGDVHNITIEDCNISGYGYAVQGYGVNVTVRDCVVESCKSGLNIQNNGKSWNASLFNLVVDGCTITANAQSTSDAYAIRAADGYTNDLNDITITNCVLSVNSNGYTPAVGKYHVAIAIRANAAGTLSAHNNVINGPVLNQSTVELNATNNYWGSASPEFGTIITGPVAYDPWLTVTP